MSSSWWSTKEPVNVLSPDSVFAAKVLVLLGILGIFLNIFVFWSLRKSKAWSAAANILYLNLMVADLIHLIYMTCFQMYHVITGNEAISYAWCQTIGIITHGVQSVGCVSIIFQAVNPFLVIVLQIRPLSDRDLILLVISQWIIVGGLLPALVLIGNDSYIVQDSGLWCYVNFESQHSVTKGLMYSSSCILLSSFLAMIGTYFLIYRKMLENITRDSIANNYQEGGNQNKSNSGSESTTEARSFVRERVEMKIMQRGLIVCGVYILLWGYIGIQILISTITATPLSSAADIAITTLGLTSNVTNPLVLIIADHRVRQTIFELFEPDYKANGSLSGSLPLLKTFTRSEPSSNPLSLSRI